MRLLESHLANFFLPWNVMSIAVTRLKTEDKNGHYVVIGFIEENDHELTFEFARASLVCVKENDDWFLLNKIQAVTNESLARLHDVLNCIDPKK